MGGPKYYNHYPWGWAWAGDTPFRRWKRETYRGGTSDPFIVHWPEHLKGTGKVRTQYAHAIDMVPTVLEALGIEPPETHQGLHAIAARGRQLRRTPSRTPNAPTKHLTQYFEMMGHRCDLSRGLARGLPVAGAFVHGGGASPSGRRSLMRS